MVVEHVIAVVKIILQHMFTCQQQFPASAAPNI